MNIENLKFYLDNLLPGFALFISLIIILPPLPAHLQNSSLVTEVFQSQFILSACFLAISYLLGTLSAVISRFFVDWLSERFFRPWILRRLSHKTYNQLQSSLVSLPSEGSKWRKAWNEAYRASLRYVLSNSSQEVIAEIGKRREQGRLIRNLFFPLLLGSAAMLQWLQIRSGWITVITLLLIGTFSICVYSYAEYTTFAEAILHLPEAENKKPKQQRAGSAKP
jgi:ABC-type multidrug transport system fused ATPase/permease subunit